MRKPFIIIESGSTKADWIFVKGLQQMNLSSSGMNPSHKTDFSNILESEELKMVLLDASYIYFYGAGVSDDESVHIVKSNFQKYSNAHIDVKSDMVAAARSCLHNEKGIVGILGTGSNACFYNGNETLTPFPSLGYIFADEGSGNHIGKEIIKSYFYGEMPKEVSQQFSTLYQLDRFDVLKAMYHDHKGPSYLAAFTTFLENVEGEWKSHLLNTCFKAFIENWILKINGYKDYPIHLIGSIAFHFQKEIRQSFHEYGLHVQAIVQKPIDGLMEYHLLKNE